MLLQAILSQLAQTNPQMFQLISQNQEEFIKLLMDDGNYLFYFALLQTKYTFQGPRGGSDRVRDPNTVRVTTQEKAAIDRVSI